MRHRDPMNQGNYPTKAYDPVNKEWVRFDSSSLAVNYGNNRQNSGGYHGNSRQNSGGSHGNNRKNANRRGRFGSNHGNQGTNTGDQKNYGRDMNMEGGGGAGKYGGIDGGVRLNNNNLNSAGKMDAVGNRVISIGGSDSGENKPNGYWSRGNTNDNHGNQGNRNGNPGGSAGLIIIPSNGYPTPSGSSLYSTAAVHPGAGPQPNNGGGLPNNSISFRPTNQSQVRYQPANQSQARYQPANQSQVRGGRRRRPAARGPIPNGSSLVRNDTPSSASSGDDSKQSNHDNHNDSKPSNHGNQNDATKYDGDNNDDGDDPPTNDGDTSSPVRS